MYLYGIFDCNKDQVLISSRGPLYYRGWLMADLVYVHRHVCVYMMHDEKDTRLSHYCSLDLSLEEGYITCIFNAVNILKY